jgi:adenylate cyclase
MNKWLTSSWMVVITLLILTTVRWWDPTPVQRLRLLNFDGYQALLEKTTSDKIVLYDIGEEFLKEHGQWPPKRTVFAQLIADLYNAGAGLVVLNILFAEEDRLGGDADFISVLQQVPVVGTQVASVRGRDDDATPRGLSYSGDPLPYLFQYPGAVKNIKPIADALAGIGMVSTVPEVDGVVRRMPLFVRVGEKVIYPSLPMEILRVLVNSKSAQIKTEAAGITKVRVRGFPIVETDPNARIWIDYSTHIERNTDVKGKIVIVGLTAEGLTQTVPTPFGPQDIHEVNAKTLHTIMTGTSIKRLDTSLLIELGSFFLFGIILILVVPRVSVKWTIPTFVLLFSGVAYAGVYSFSHHRLLFDLAYPLGGGLLLYVQLMFNNFAREFRLKQQIKKQFGTYLSPAMVMILQKNPELLKLGGETKKLTIMFSDIRGFTPISEQYKTDPQGLTSLINRFLTPMTDLLMGRKGTIDKYMGDCIMAFWNAPVNVDEHEKQAVESALEMVDKLDELNAELESEGKLPIKIGIGINTGEVVVGNMGSNNRFDYSILGDAANLASRLEGQSKGYGVTIILGEETATAVENDLFNIELDSIAVKGKKDSVRIFTVLGNNEWVFKNTNWYFYQQQHEKFLKLYRGQAWETAARFATDLKREWTEMSDYYDIMLGRIQSYLENPPGDDWDGVYRAETK